jgi:hypothetical protein
MLGYLFYMLIFIYLFGTFGTFRSLGLGLGQVLFIYSFI